ncbi:hypothetical protein Tco_1100564, partial [Tanacetum coccineum]
MIRRSSFARCLIEVNSKADLVDVVTIGIPSLSEDVFTKEIIRVEYEWRPPRCDKCKIFGHVHDYFPKKVVSPHIVATSNVVTPNAEKTNDGFQTVGKKKKRKGKFKSTNGGQFTGPSVKHNVRYEPKATTSAPKKGTTYVGYTSQSTPMLKTTGNSSKKDNLSMSNSFSVLKEKEDDEEDVKNVYDESANLIQNTKASGSSSFTAAAVCRIPLDTLVGSLSKRSDRFGGSVDNWLLLYIRRVLLIVLLMKHGFLSQKGNEGGRGVKEKHSSMADKERSGVEPSVTVVDATPPVSFVAKEVVSPSVVDETVAKEKQSPMVNTTGLGSSQETNTAGNAP